VFSLGRENAREKDVLIAEVTYPSLGAGGEIMSAYEAGKPIILVSHSAMDVSRFVLGNPAVVYHIVYETYDKAIEKIEAVLKQL